MPLAGVIEYIYPGAAQTRIQTIVACSAVVRPAVRCRELALIDGFGIAVGIQGRQASREWIVDRLSEVHREIGPQPVGQVQPIRYGVFVLDVDAELPDVDVLALVRPRPDHPPEIDGSGGFGRVEEIGQRGERARR